MLNNERGRHGKRPPSTIKSQNMHGNDYAISPAVNQRNAIESFRNAAAADGIIIPDNPPIGKIFACGTKDKPQSKNGRGLLYLDGRPAGGYENMSSGRGWQKWRFSGSKLTSTGHSAEYRRRIEQERRERAEVEARRYSEAAM